MKNFSYIRFSLIIFSAILLLSGCVHHKGCAGVTGNSKSIDAKDTKDRI